MRKLTGKKSKSSLDQNFNFKLGCFCYERNCMKHTTTHTSKVESLALVLSCQLKFVNGIPL